MSTESNFKNVATAIVTLAAFPFIGFITTVITLYVASIKHSKTRGLA